MHDTPTAPLLERPLRDLAAWTAYFRSTELPVLPSTAERLEAWREREEQADAQQLGQAFARDPFMTLKILAHLGQLRRGREGTPVETVTAALVMMGVGPFFHHFGPQPTVTARLADHREARQGLRAVMLRSQRAAAFALAFAVHRMDRDTDLIHEAALLHDFAEMLLWVHAPQLALKIAQAQAKDPQLRSSLAQKDVLGIELADLQQALLKAWGLSELLARVMDDQPADTSQVRTVQLAARVARHSARGWDNAALPDDVAAVAELLNLAHEPTLRLLREIDAG